MGISKPDKCLSSRTLARADQEIIKGMLIARWTTPRIFKVRRPPGGAALFHRAANRLIRRFRKFEKKVVSTKIFFTSIFEKF